jgi:hypothetical protein
MSHATAAQPALTHRATGVHAFRAPRRHFAMLERVLAVAVSGYLAASLLSLLA